MASEVASGSWPRPCCVCGRQDNGLVVLFEAHAFRGPSVYTCPHHSRQEIVFVSEVFTRLRAAEMDYYRQHLCNPAAVVWLSKAFIVLGDKRSQSHVKLPDGVSVLMAPGEACPEIFAVGDVAEAVVTVFEILARRRDSGGA